MARTINKTVNLKDITFDESLYPRSVCDWQTTYDYLESMKTGAKFPPIDVAMWNNKLVLVDGKHRIEALKRLKKKKVNARVHTNWSREKIFKEAVRANIAHGRGLSPYEKRKIAVKLMEMKCSKSEVSGLIQVPQERLTNFVGKNLVNTITGKKINSEEHEKEQKQMMAARAGEQGFVLKSSLSNLGGREFSQEEVAKIEDVQKNWSAGSQIRTLQETIDLIENDFLDKEDEKVMQLYEKLVNLIYQGS